MKLFTILLGLLGLLVGGSPPGARGAGGLVIKNSDQDVRRRDPRLPNRLPNRLPRPPPAAGL